MVKTTNGHCEEKALGQLLCFHLRPCYPSTSTRKFSSSADRCASTVLEMLCMNMQQPDLGFSWAKPLLHPGSLPHVLYIVASQDKCVWKRWSHSGVNVPWELLISAQACVQINSTLVIIWSLFIGRAYGSLWDRKFLLPQSNCLLPVNITTLSSLKSGKDNTEQENGLCLSFQSPWKFCMHLMTATFRLK